MEKERASQGDASTTGNEVVSNQDLGHISDSTRRTERGKYSNALPLVPLFVGALCILSAAKGPSEEAMASRALLGSVLILGGAAKVGEQLLNRWLEE